MGTSFKIYFPRLEDKRVQGAEIRKSGDVSRGFETVLIAEDEDSVLRLAGRILRSRGYTVLEARDGMEAVAIAQGVSGKIHLVITDIVMPGISGQALVSRLEDLRPGIRSLYISGYTDSAIVHHGILDSNVTFLQKPFTIESLTQKVRDALDR
jgi:DNA-binding NtrC family response regulator